MMRPISRSYHTKSNNRTQSNGFRQPMQVRTLSTQENNAESSTSSFRTVKSSAMQSGMGGAFGLGVVGLALGAFFWSSKDDDNKDKKETLTGSVVEKALVGNRVSDSQFQAKKTTGEGKPDVIFFLGGAGSNSDKYAMQAAKEFGWVVIKTEDLIEGEIASGSDKGKAFKQKLNKGEKLPSDMVVDLVETAVMKERNGNTRFIIADFPRSAEDATSWDRKMENKVNLRMVFLVDNATPDVRQRISAVDKPYTDEGEAGKLSYQQQALGVVKQYPGITTKLVDSKEPQDVMVQVRDVFNYINNDQELTSVVDSGRKRITSK